MRLGVGQGLDWLNCIFFFCVGRVLPMSVIYVYNLYISIVPIRSYLISCVVNISFVFLSIKHLDCMWFILSIKLNYLVAAAITTAFPDLNITYLPSGIIHIELAADGCCTPVFRLVLEALLSELTATFGAWVVLYSTPHVLSLLSYD